MPQFAIPQLTLDEVIRDVDLESTSSFDSDLANNVDEFSPLYNALQRKDKFYVMTNIKHMLNSVRLGSYCLMFISCSSCLVVHVSCFRVGKRPDFTFDCQIAVYFFVYMYLTNCL